MAQCWKVISVGVKLSYRALDLGRIVEKSRPAISPTILGYICCSHGLAGRQGKISGGQYRRQCCQRRRASASGNGQMIVETSRQQRTPFASFCVAWGNMMTFQRIRAVNKAIKRPGKRLLAVSPHPGCHEGEQERKRR
jgi:hypothetical protein